MAGKTHKVRLELEDPNGLGDVSQVVINLTSQADGPQLSWNASTGFNHNSLLFLDESNSGWTSNPNSTLHWIEMTFSLNSSVIFEEGNHDVQVVVTERNITSFREELKTFGSAWRYEDDLILESLVFDDLTGLVALDFEDGHLLAGGDTVRLMGRVHIEGDSQWNPPGDLISVSVTNSSTTFFSKLVDQFGNFNVSMTVPMVTILDGENYTFVLDSPLGGDLGTLLDTSRKVSIDAQVPTITSFESYLDYHDLQRFDFNYTIKDNHNVSPQSRLHWQVLLDDEVQTNGSMVAQLITHLSQSARFETQVDLTEGGSFLFSLTDLDDYLIRIWITASDLAGNHLAAGMSPQAPYVDLPIHYADPDLRVHDLQSVNAQPLLGNELTLNFLLSNDGGVIETPFEIQLLVDGLVVESQELTSFSKWITSQRQFKWVPLSEGIHALEIIVDPGKKLLETNESNNRVTILVEVVSAGQDTGTQSSAGKSLLLVSGAMIVPALLAALLLRRRKRRTFMTDYNLDGDYQSPSEMGDQRRQSMETYVREEYDVTLSSQAGTTQGAGDQSLLNWDEIDDDGPSQTWGGGIYHDRERSSGWDQIVEGHDKA